MGAAGTLRPVGRRCTLVHMAHHDTGVGAICLCAAAILSLHGTGATQSAHISPLHPTQLDSVSVFIDLGSQQTSCVPVYTALTVDTSCPSCSWPSGPLEGNPYPRQYLLDVDWSAEPPDRGAPCYDTIVHYGPRFAFGPLAPGTYTMVRGMDTLAAFQVSRADTLPCLGGWVSHGPVFLDSVTVVLTPDSTDSSVGRTATTDSVPFFEFVDVAPGSYTLSLSRDGYSSLTVPVEVDSHTVLPVTLLPEGAFIMYSGTVTGADPSQGRMPGCSVTVDFGPSCDDSAITVLTDSDGRFSLAPLAVRPHTAAFSARVACPACVVATVVHTIDRSGEFYDEHITVDSAFPCGAQVSEQNGDIGFALCLRDTVCSTGVDLRAVYSITNGSGSAYLLHLDSLPTTAGGGLALGSVRIHTSDGLVLDSVTAGGWNSGAATALPVCPGQTFAAMLPAVAPFPHSDTVVYSARLPGCPELSITLAVANPLGTLPSPSTQNGPAPFTIRGERGQVVVVFSEPSVATIEIYSLDGRVVARAEQNGHNSAVCLTLPSAARPAVLAVAVSTRDGAWTGMLRTPLCQRR